MQLRYRNIVSFFLLVLIFFSTIGFNIISTMCDGCDVEYTSIIITSIEEDLSCECCETDSNEMSCCKSEDSHNEEHHQSSSVFAKLNFDSPEVKAKTFKAEVPVFLVQHFIHILFNTKINSEKPVQSININFSPPLAGRTLLNLICILRN